MIRHLLNTDVDVYRSTKSGDSRGGKTITWDKVVTVRARVSQPTAAEREVAGRMGATLEAIVHVLYAEDIRRGDELDIGALRRMRVQAVVSDSSHTYKRLECQELQGA